jgi:hypothetical protein
MRRATRNWAIGPGGSPGYTADPDNVAQESIVFLETVRDGCAVGGYDAATIEQQTVVHEVGHQVTESDQHTPHTIMQDSLPVAPEDEKFSDADIAKIRSEPSSPGT